MAEELGLAGAAGRCDFERADGAELTPEAFQERYLRQRPVVLSGLTDGWAGRELWSRERLLERHGGLEVTHAQASDVAQFGPKEGGGKALTSTLADWVQRTMDARPSGYRGATAFAFDRSAGNVAYTLRQGGEFSPPGQMAAGRMEQLLLSLGPPRAGLPLHTHGDAWLGLTHGRKLWMVFPPTWGNESHPAAYTALALRSATAVLTGGLLESLPEEERPLLCLQRPGETVYLPALWWQCAQIAPTPRSRARSSPLSLPACCVAAPRPTSRVRSASAGRTTWAGC